MVNRSRWVAAALWALFIELLTSWPRLPSFVAADGFDKVAHAGVYAVFAFLVIRAAQLGRPSVGATLITLVAIMAWAALDEWHQEFIPGRGAEVADWIADSVGVAIGLGVRWIKTPRLSAGSAA